MNELLMAGLTDPGKIRPENEDCIAAKPEIGLAVVADGMGGHQAGEVASSMAVDLITRYFLDAFSKSRDGGKNAENDTSLEVKITNEAIQLANSAIYEVAHARPDCAGMGSTIVVTVFYEDKICVGHVGDSRLYRFRMGILEQMTEDHSVVQELLNRGLVSPDEAHTTIGKNLVTRALGVDPTVEPDVCEETLMDDDIYLLCSDGLNEVLADGDIELILTESSRDLEHAVRQMVAMANERGGPDNISVILVRTGESFTRSQKAMEELQETMKQV